MELTDVSPQQPAIEPVHAGDGVYLSFDGFHINLAVNHHNNHAISLERSVWAQVVKYGQRLGWAVK